MWIPADRIVDISRELQRYEKLEIEIKQLCGHIFESLRNLFAMGYTIEPHTALGLTFSEIARLIDEGR